MKTHHNIFYDTQNPLIGRIIVGFPLPERGAMIICCASHIETLTVPYLTLLYYIYLSHAYTLEEL
jgi:hypothetical protein